MQGCAGNGDNGRDWDHWEDLGLGPRVGQQQILRRSLEESPVHTVARKTEREGEGEGGEGRGGGGGY